MGDTATCPECAAERAEQARDDGWPLTRLTRGKLRERRAEWAREQQGLADARASADASFRRARDARDLRQLVERFHLHGTGGAVP